MCVLAIAASLLNIPLVQFSSSSQKDQMLWDSFQDPPPPQSSGSAIDNKRFDTFKKCLKLFTYILVFVVVLAATVGAKLTFLFMTSHIKSGYVVKYCDIRSKYVFIE